MRHAQLRAFHAVAVHGSFSKAADKLFRTQPAISDQVTKLEKDYEVQLFDRHKRTVKLTNTGRKLLDITRKMFEMENEARELLSESQALKRGHLNIAADAPTHVVQLIGNFQQQYPGISISLSIGNSDEVMRQLLEYQADICVIANAPTDSRFKSLKLRSDPLVAFVSTNHSWAKRRSITLADFENEQLVMREKGSSTRQIIEEEFNSNSITCNIAMEAESREAIREAVAAEVGVGIVSEPEFGFDPRLKAISIRDWTRSMTESLVCLKERASLRGISAFWIKSQEHFKHTK